jgi:bidirectional [NiFe] hydrogenase diaphorase subunit
MEQGTDRTAQAFEDKRLRVVERTMRLHGNTPHALIETLHAVQETYGYLDVECMRFVARTLKVPLSKVYGVATFYHYFTMKPPGAHTCVVCTGTACYIAGASQILGGISESFGIAPRETTEDGRISLVTARCLGACGLAPAAVFDGQVVGKQQKTSVCERLERWRRDDS